MAFSIDLPDNDLFNQQFGGSALSPGDPFSENFSFKRDDDEDEVDNKFSFDRATPFLKGFMESRFKSDNINSYGDLNSPIAFLGKANPRSYLNYLQ